jgi:DNA-binding MarR family transcriptional regulator
MYTIYALIDVRDNSIRYVGVTKNTFNCLSQHLLDTGNNTPKGLWLVEMQQAGVAPKLEVLEVINSSEDAYQIARERERYWIQKLTSEGSSLINTNGIGRRTESSFGLDRTQLAAWRTFITTHAVVIEQIEHELIEAKKLPLSSYDVLLALVEAPNRRLRMNELAQAVVLSRSGLTRLVDRLEHEGLLRRDRSGPDRRATYAVLTLKGFRAFRHAWPIYAQGIVKHFIQYLNEEEIGILTQMLERLLASARESSSLTT